MSKEQQTIFLLANLGPEIARYISFRTKGDRDQMLAAKKRFLDIYYKIVSLGILSRFGNKELTMFCESVLDSTSIQEKDVNVYFYPFILKLQA